jgi:hypothetical protein
MPSADAQSVGDAKGRRVDAATGLVFAVLFLVAFLLPGAPPKADASTHTIINFFTGKRGSILAGNYILGVGSLFFVWFLGSLRSYLRAAEGGEGRLSSAAFGGGLVGIAVTLAGVAVFNGIAFKVAHQGDGTLIRGLFDADNALFTVAAFGFAAFFAATSCSAARSGAFAPWIYWSGSVIALIQLVSGVALFAGSGFFAVGGAFGLIGLLLALLWTAAVSVVMIQRRSIPPVGGAAP